MSVESDSRVNVLDGMHTYGQHIQLSEALVAYTSKKEPNDLDRVDLMVKVFDILNYKQGNVKEAQEYFEYVCNSLVSWAERSKKLLTHIPSADEEAAGSKKLAEVSGSFGIVKHIAKDYHYKLDEVLQLEWVNVFTLLYIERLEAEYERRLWKQHEAKMKAKTGKNWKNKV